ncbi:MAG: small ribosomal subunit biogenesis GTPase RsgA [Gammaproteobacteria bacterium]|nr:small ribosomal subunit biogenesis GTPase RsgA [Gammaproteobacteria bacterium]MDH5778871.1 small ribosomal subunit biogenesis GTPase RsgA [Gammaproteobacteria bacterium]
MAKRKLNKRQQSRVKEQQQKHRQSADASNSSSNRKNNTESGNKGIVIANFGSQIIVETDNRTRISCSSRQNIESLVSGDHVIWQNVDDDSGVVVALEPRTNYIARPDRRNKAKVIAANIDQLLIVTAVKPVLNSRLVDRYLVAAETARITPVIVFNKIDLPDEAAMQQFRDDLAIYKQLNYSVAYTSAKFSQGIDAFQEMLKAKTSVFVGQSGVGKSSLLNCLLPEALAEVGDISTSTQKGRHTTTVAQLYHLPEGGQIIDSPGVREFGLWQVTEEQAAEGFPEFRPWLGQCRFRDCKHQDEPGCAVRNAVEEGEIAPQRWDSYKRILNSLMEEQH